MYLRGRLLIWLWDASEVQAALDGTALEKAALRPVPETLLRAVPAVDGLAIQEVFGGQDHLRVADGAIVESHFLPAAHVLSPDALLSRPWGRDLLHAGGVGSASLQGNLHRKLNYAVWALAAASVLPVAYVAGQSRAREEFDTSQSLVSVDDDAGRQEYLRLRQLIMAEDAWLRGFRSMSGSVPLAATLDCLRRPLEASGLTLRDFELRDRDVRLTFASSTGDIDLARLVESLTKSPAVASVQLRQSNEPQAASLSLRLAEGLSAESCASSPERS